MKSSQFDGLRGFACLLVVFAHLRVYGYYLHEVVAFGRFGQFGLYLFFFLSAWLISKSIYVGMSPENIYGRGWLAYLIRRTLRIVPLYYLVLLIDYNLFGFYFGSSGSHNAAALWQHMLFLDGRSALWTMPVEVRFYFLLIPLMLVLWICLRLPVKWKHISIGSVAIASVAWLFYVYSYDKQSIIATWGVHPYAPYFVFGAVWCAVRIGFSESLDRLPTRFWNILGLSALVFFVAQNPYWWQAFFPSELWTYDPDHIRALRFDVWLEWRAYAMVLVVTIIFLATDQATGWLKYLFSLSVLRWFGRYSFGIYLLHLPFIYIVHEHITTDHVVGFLTVFALSLGLAVALHHVIEKPGIRLGNRLAGIVENARIPTKLARGPAG